MKTLTIYYPGDGAIVGGIVIIRACNRCHLAVFDQLQTEIQQHWIRSDNNTSLIIKEFWPYFEAIARLMVRVDGEKWQIDDLRSEIDLLESLFLKAPSQLQQLHQYEPPQTGLEDPEKPDPFFTPPPPSSGDREADFLAYLTNKYGFRDALFAWNNLDAGTLDCMISTLNQMAQDPKERLKAWQKQRFIEQAREDKDIIAAALGLDEDDLDF